MLVTITVRATLSNLTALRVRGLVYSFVKEFTRARRAERLPDRAAHALNGAITRVDRIYALAIVLALGMTTFLAVDQNWILLLLAGLAALSTDGIVRTHPRARFERLDDTALYLFVPVLFTLGLGLFLEEVAEGYWTVAAGLLSAVPYWLILRAEYESVDRPREGVPVPLGSIRRLPVLNGWYSTASRSVRLSSFSPRSTTST